MHKDSAIFHNFLLTCWDRVLTDYLGLAVGEFSLQSGDCEANTHINRMMLCFVGRCPLIDN